MRITSAAVAKGRYAPPYLLVPTEGTRIRAVFDLFTANKGLPIEWKPTKYEYQALTTLIDFYGLDIRHLRKDVWVLAGEWFDVTYIDYIADRLGRS